MDKPVKRKNQGKYSPQLKITIAREYLTTDMGYRCLSVKYDIPLTSIVDFVKWYKKKYGEEIVELPENEIVQKPLDDSQLKVTALELLIENASKELGVDLVKKFGTKQRNK